MNSELSKVDNDLTQYVDELNIIAGNLSFIQIKEFELEETTENICDASYARNGIYYFQLKNNKEQLIQHWAQEFKALWKPDSSQPEHSLWSPGIKKMRVAFHTDAKDWIPFYIGKCHNVGHRINEHLNQPGTRRTFSMKLKVRKNLYGSIFRVSWIPLDVINYDWIAPIIENKLRNIYHPILGKQ